MPRLPTSASELFDQILPELLSAQKEQAKELGGIYAFRLPGQGGGEWTVDLTLDVPKVTQGASSHAQCTITVDHADFIELLKSPSEAMALFLAGKIKVTGNPMLALKFQKLFSLGTPGGQSIP